MKNYGFLQVYGKPKAFFEEYRKAYKKLCCSGWGATRLNSDALSEYENKKRTAHSPLFVELNSFFHTQSDAAFQSIEGVFSMFAHSHNKVCWLTFSQIWLASPWVEHNVTIYEKQSCQHSHGRAAKGGMMQTKSDEQTMKNRSSGQYSFGCGIFNFPYKQCDTFSRKKTRQKEVRGLPSKQLTVNFTTSTSLDIL